MTDIILKVNENLKFLDYHQYLKNMNTKKTPIQQNNVSTKNKTKDTKITKNSSEDKKKEEMYVFNDNWNEFLVENHFCEYKNIEKTNLLEIK